MKIYHRILVLPDIHLPFHNKAAIKRIAEFNKTYKADLVIQLGDLVDAHAWSRWPKASSAMSPDHEFAKARKGAEWLHKLFPKMVILHGNHDLRASNKRLDAGIPSQFIKTFAELFNFKGWTFHEPKRLLTVNTPKGKVSFCHGDEAGGTPLEKAKTLGHSLVQGHTHKATISYHTGQDGKTVFGAEGGHLVDVDSYAFRYALGSLKKGTIGFLVIEKGIPTFVAV